MTANVLVAAAIVGALAYLRDPAWLIHVSSGLGRWQQDRDGRRFRWTRGRASFFVPAGARLVRVPVRALLQSGDVQPFLVRIDVDDRFANLVALPDERWTEAEVRIVPARGWWRRRVVRLDLHVDHTWSDRSLGVQVGEVTWGGARVVLPGDARAQLSKGRKDLAPSLDGRALPDTHAPTDAPGSARPSLQGNGKDAVQTAELRSSPRRGGGQEGS